MTNPLAQQNWWQSRQPVDKDLETRPSHKLRINKKSRQLWIIGNLPLMQLEEGKQNMTNRTELKNQTIELSSHTDPITDLCLSMTTNCPVRVNNLRLFMTMSCHVQVADFLPSHDQKLVQQIVFWISLLKSRCSIFLNTPTLLPPYNLFLRSQVYSDWSAA